MLPKKERLARAEVVEVMKSGRSGRGSPHFGLKYLPAMEPKYAVVVSKKVLRSAADRHRARRRVYDALRESQAAWLPAHSVIFVRQDVSVLPFDSLRNEINSLLSHISPRRGA